MGSKTYRKLEECQNRNKVSGETVHVKRRSELKKKL